MKEIRKIILTLLFCCLIPIAYTQNTYTKDEIDLKFELQQEKIDSKLNVMERENNSIDNKLASQDKQIENLKYIFGILLSLIAIVVGTGAFFVNNRNKERFSDLEDELKSTKEDALQELNRIKDIANLEVKLAKAELNALKFEAEQVKKNLNK